MIDVTLLFGCLYLGYRIFRKPGESLFYKNSQL
nr:MAG TPA: hypothetical protein [Caudoviricetes sp.]